MTVLSERFIPYFERVLAPGVSEAFKSLEAVNPVQRPDWNALACSHPSASFFHSAEWISVLADTYAGFHPYCLTARNGAELLAAIPLVEVKCGWGHRKAVGVPFADSCSPLIWEARNLPDLWQGLLQHARLRHWRSIELRGGRALVGTAVPSVSYYGHVLDLSPGLDTLFSNLDSATRRAIRKAEREGVTTEISQAISALHDYYALHCRVRRRHGLPPQPFRFFEALHDRVISTGQGFVVTAKWRGAAIAAGVFMRFGDEALFKFGASDERWQSLRGNNLVMWQAIRRFAGDGLGRLHFGRTSLANEGLRRFKRAWGAEEQVLEYFKFDLKKQAFVVDKDRTTGWHNHFFRIAPRWLGRVLGSLLYGRLA